jgi:hypothetical protein
MSGKAGPDSEFGASLPTKRIWNWLSLHIMRTYIVIRIGTCLTSLVPGHRDLVERKRPSCLPMIIIRAKERPQDLIQGEVFCCTSVPWARESV